MIKNKFTTFNYRKLKMLAKEFVEKCKIWAQMPAIWFEFNYYY
jgi:hypothetical protein